MSRIKLAENERLYPLGTEDVDGKSYLTTWMETEPMNWFFAVMVGNEFRPYWDQPLGNNIVVEIFDNKEEAKKFMLENLQPGIYLSFGWVIQKKEAKGK